jgi:hypothetical protein
MSTIDPVTILHRSLELLVRYGHHDSNDTVFIDDPKHKDHYKVNKENPWQFRRSMFEFFLNPSGDGVAENCDYLVAQFKKFDKTKLSVKGINIVGAVILACLKETNWDVKECFGDTVNDFDGLVMRVFKFVNDRDYGFYEKFESSDDKLMFWIGLVSKVSASSD